MSNDFRPWEPDELAIVERLLDEPRLGREQIRAQLQLSQVRFWPECNAKQHCQSLEILVGDGAPLIPEEVPSPYPVEGQVVDTDGVPIDIWICHDKGMLTLLEFIVYSDRMKELPRASEIEIVNS